MMICEKCGAVFEYPNSRKDWDTGCTEELCPECHSEYITNAVQCELCGEWVQEDEAYGYGHAVCEKCIIDGSDDLDMLNEATKDECEEFDLPLLLRWFYTDDDIIELLMDDLKKRYKAGYVYPVEIKNFTRRHMNDVADQLLKEHGQ